ncbi:restriction endonuclease subunit S [Streptococcus gordonii]|uniref:restriction endonuclease subunit S n=1 Tax=Streptococcus gordonii TaxID=1302 RepID=UPI00228436D9|nr:restriction endonuclease subunit S [Streptococcus gordonii]MCY7139087.1 restriction endonuclease subunit S [Streptococcus gordonii]
MKLSDWKEYRIGELIETIFSGGTPNTKNSDYWNGSLPWLSSGETRNRYINVTEKTITDSGAQNSSTRQALKGDVVMASAGQGYTRGQVSFLNIDTFINQSVIAIRANEKVLDKKFLFYNLSSRYEELRAISDSNSIRGSITTKMVKSMNIRIPDLNTQKAIANTLSSIDDKIETSKQINHHLEEILQANLEKQLESISIKSKIIDLNLTVSDHVANGSFKALKDNVKLVEKTDYALFLRNIDLKNHLNGERRYVTESSYEFLKKSRLYGHEVIISNVADVGSVHRVPKMNMPMVAGNNVVFLQSENSLLTDYLYVYFNSRLGQHDIMSITSGSAQQKFNKTDFRNLEIPILSDDIIKKKISSILHYMDNIHEEIACLMKIRATLLPKLLSGEISVN